MLRELPDGWEWCELQDVAEVRLGRQRSPKNHHGDNMVPYIRAANVTWDGLELSDVKEMNFTVEEVETYALRDGDIVLSEASGSATEVGKPAIWRGELEPCCLQNTLVRVRTEGPLPEYLMLVLRQAAVSGAFVPAALGVGIHHIGAARLSAWPVPLPPLDEQRRIVAAVGAIEAEIDRGSVDLETAITLLGSFRTSVVDAAIRGELVSQGDEAEQLRAALLRRRQEAWEENQLRTLTSKGKEPKGDAWKKRYPAPAEPSNEEYLPAVPATWSRATVDEAAIDW
jgi:type I restriction enzyme, S subunit